MFEKGQINLGSIISTAIGVALAVAVVNLITSKMAPVVVLPPTAPASTSTTPASE